MRRNQTDEAVCAGLSRDSRNQPEATRRAEGQAAKMIRRLRKVTGDDGQAKRLANELDGCSPTDPCWSGACPMCGLAVRRHLTGQIGKFVRDHSSNGEVITISIIVPSSAVPVGELGKFSPTNFARRLKYALDRADVDWVIGALDYSVNFHEGDRYEPHWAVHLHGFTATDDQQALRRRLIGVIKKSDAVPRPVRVKPWDGDKKAIRYALKTNFQRRKGIDDAERFDPKTGKSRTCRATKTQRLLAAEKVELALHLDRIGWEGRLFMRHAQLRRSQSGPVIALMNNNGISD